MNVNIENNTPEVKEYEVDLGNTGTPIRIKGSKNVFYMDFGDVEFPNRLNKAKKQIINLLNEQKRKTEKKLNFEENLAVLDETDKGIKAALNKAFNYNVSDVVFGALSSIGITPNGEFYFENFINSIIPIVEKEYNTRMSKMSSRSQMYMSQKGQHPNPYIKR